MKFKVLLTIALCLFFFLGEIAISFSFKKENDRNLASSEIVPLSYKIAEELPGDSLTNEIDEFVEQFLKKNKVAGASVAVAKEGKLVYAKGFGLANKEKEQKVEPHHLFRIASVSKLITAVTVMKLVEEEKLSLDDLVFGSKGILNDSSYLKIKDKRINTITVKNLLNHTAGWNGKKSDPVFNSLYVAYSMKIEPPASIENIIEYSLNKRLDYTPGKKYSYSNLGYCILGEIIETVTGMSYEDYVQFAILHPLGIYDMHIGRSFEEDKYFNEVKYYNKERTTDIWAFDGTKKIVPIIYGGNNMELLGAAGGWVASAPELAKLMVAIDGFESRPDILSLSSIKTMTESKTRSRKLIGWRGTDGHGTWWRTGTLAGTSALLMRHRNETNWVILLNTSTQKKSKIHNELSHVMFQSIRAVDEWPEYDLFNIEPDFFDTELAISE